MGDLVDDAPGCLHSCSTPGIIDAEVFSQPEFMEYAAKKLVLVGVDFPKGFTLPEATKKQNG